MTILHTYCLIMHTIFLMHGLAYFTRRAPGYSALERTREKVSFRQNSTAFPLGLKCRPLRRALSFLLPSSQSVTTINRASSSISFLLFLQEYIPIELTLILASNQMAFSTWALSTCLPEERRPWPSLYRSLIS